MRVLAVAVLLLLLAGCGRANPPERDVHPTLVSLNPCADAILAEVAAPGQLLAISHFSKNRQRSSMAPEIARRYRATGGTVEEVLALAPDIVVADSFLSPPARAAFERLGIRVETIGIASDIEQAWQQVRNLAAVTGERERGEALVQRIDKAWSQAAYDGQPLPTLMWQEGGIVPGPDSLVAAMLEHSGFALHSAARGLGQGAYLPLERVLADPPALVLASSGERMLTHNALRQVPGLAYRTFDPSLLYCAGPTIPRALERLAEIRRGFAT